MVPCSRHLASRTSGLVRDLPWRHFVKQLLPAGRRRCHRLLRLLERWPIRYARWQVTQGRGELSAGASALVAYFVAHALVMVRTSLPIAQSDHTSIVSAQALSGSAFFHFYNS